MEHKGMRDSYGRKALPSHLPLPPCDTSVMSDRGLVIPLHSSIKGVSESPWITLSYLGAYFHISQNVLNWKTQHVSILHFAKAGRQTKSQLGRTSSSWRVCCHSLGTSYGGQASIRGVHRDWSLQQNMLHCLKEKYGANQSIALSMEHTECTESGGKRTRNSQTVREVGKCHLTLIKWVTETYNSFSKC